MGGGVSKFLSSKNIVNKNENSSYVSLRDLIEKDQTSFSVTSFITSTTLTTTSPTKTKIGGCGNYTTIEMYDKLNLDDKKLSSPSFDQPYLNYPNDFSFSDYGEDKNKDSLFDISSRSLSKEGLKEKKNKNPVPQVQEIEDTMVEKAIKGRMFIEDLKVMLLDVMAMSRTNERLRVHIVLEQVADNENDRNNSKNSKGRV